MSISVGQAVGYLELDTSNFKSGFKSALEDLRAFNDDSATTSTKLTALSSAFTAAGSTLTKSLTLPIVGVGTAAVGIAASFESAMSEVQAISGATGEEFEALKQEAIDLGGSTAFSAQEVASAMTEMAKAGWSTQQILDGMSGVLDAAAASGESLGTVSTIVADAITGFGLAASDSTRVADLLTQAANSGTIGIYDLGETFKYISPVANAMGLSIEDVTTAVAAMSMAGIKGSQAGTGLRTTLTNLVKPTETMATALQELGLMAEATAEDFKGPTDNLGMYNTALLNADGTMKDLNGILQSLREAFSGLSEAEKTQYAAAIAGKEGMSALLSIVTMTQEEYDALSDTMYNSQGVADETARVMQDNLSSKIEQLGGSLESLAIKMGSLLIPTIQNIVTGLTNLVDWFSNLDESTQRIIVTVAAIVAAVGPVLLIVGKVISAVTTVISIVNLLKPAIAALNAVMAANPILAIVAAIAILVTALVTLYNTNEDFRNFVNTAWENIKTVISNVVASIVNFFTVTIPEGFNSFISSVKSLADNIANFFTVVIPEKIDELVQWFTELPERIGYAIGFAVGTVARWVVDLAKKAAEVGPKVIDAIVNFFTTLPGKILDLLNKALTNFVTWISNLKNKAMTVGAQVIDTVVNFFLELPGKLGNALTNALTTVQTWGSNLITWASTEIPKVISTIMEFFYELPSKMLEVGENLLKGLAEGIGNAVSSVVETVSDVASSVLNGFKDAFNIHSPSRETAEMGVFLMLGLANGVKSAANLAVSAVTTAAESVLEPVEGITDKIKSLVSFKEDPDVSFGVGDPEDKENLKAYSEEVSSLTEEQAKQASVAASLKSSLAEVMNFCVNLKNVYSTLVKSSEYLVQTLIKQKSVYDSITSSIQAQIASLKELQSLQQATSVASTLSRSESALSSSSSEKTQKTSSTRAVNVGAAASALAGATFVFNSPQAVVPTVAAKLLKQTAQQISMSIK